MEPRQRHDEERAWWRMVALLVSFARLAEQAAHRGDALRWLVLWILRHAAIVIEDAVLDAASFPPSEIAGGPVGNTGHAPQDALALAARFLWLAALLACLLSAVGVDAGRSVPRGSGSSRAHQRSGHPRLGRRPRPVDTS